MHAVTSELRKANVRSPINGCIFDELSASFADGGVVRAVPCALRERAALRRVLEWYGSYELNGSKAQFAVMTRRPTTGSRRTRTSCAAWSSRACRWCVHHQLPLRAALDWTPNRTHGVGGSRWRDGVASLVRRARAAAPGARRRW